MQQTPDLPDCTGLRALRQGACVALVLLGAAPALACAQEAAAEAPAAMPYRPTVSTPAMLSAPGWLELEAGWLRADARADSHRDSLPYSLKLAFSEDWGIRVSGEGWVAGVDADGERTRGFGDTGLILKRRFAVDARSAFGLEFGVTAPTARASLHSGSGATDYTVTGIYSSDLGTSWHTDLNASVMRLGTTDPGTNRDMLMWATALSDALNGRWSVVGEWSGSRRSGMGTTGQMLFAVSYTADKRLVLDFGFARGMTAMTPTWSVFCGGTWLLAKVF